jgi:predicted NUDIX family NTP pyrophosphohydrolase
MKKMSCGLLMYKFLHGELRVFIAHPGGPFWKDKEKGAWSIPKGEPDEGEEYLLEVAKREMKEETGIIAPSDNSKYIELGSIVQKSGKEVYAWAFEGDWFGLLICSSYAEVEWPYKSGKIKRLPNSLSFSQSAISNFQIDGAAKLRKINHNLKMIKIPEIDKAGFFSIEKNKNSPGIFKPQTGKDSGASLSVKELINPAQFELIERLVEKLK